MKLTGLLLRASLLALSALTTGTLAGNVEKWRKLASESKDGLIKLDSASYDEMLAAPRNYSVSVVLTALPVQMNCAPCREFDPVWHSIARSWKRTSMPEAAKSQHFFAVLDFPDGQDIYRRLGLQSAPTLQFHQATDGSKKVDQQPGSGFISYDFGRNGFNADKLHDWLNSLTPHQFKLYKPFNPWPYILVPAGIAFIAITVFISYPVLLPLLQSRGVWTAGCLCAIVTFISGHMWNRIRNPPYAQPGSIFAGGFSNQYVLETQAVAGMYALLAFSVIALAQLVPAVKGAHKQRVAAYLWFVVLIVMFSLLVKIFKIKNGGYPFTLLLG